MKLHRQLGRTIIHVTHDQVEAMTMGERVAVMRDGHLHQFASPTELYDHPVNVFVAGFIGSPAMNRFDGELASDGIRMAVITVRPSDAQMRAAQGHANLIVGVRPEHVSIGDGDLKLQVDLVEDLGSDFFVYGHLAEGAATNVIVRAGREHPRPGEAIKIKPDAAQLHLFDAATGQRVGD